LNGVNNSSKRELFIRRFDKRVVASASIRTRSIQALAFGTNTPGMENKGNSISDSFIVFAQLMAE
jgi:hypothetical protein